MDEVRKEFDLLEVFRPNLASMSSKEKKEEAVSSGLEAGERAFSVYEKKMADKVIYEERFVAADADRNLFARKTIGGTSVKIVMPSTESFTAAMVAKEGADKISAHAKLARNNGAYQVVVIGVDREKCEITVSHRQAIMLLKEKLDSTLKDCLARKKKGELKAPLRLSAKVVRHEKERRRFIVDLNGYSLLGFMPYNAAGKGDIASLRQGMVIDVEVFDFKPKKEIKSSTDMYACSRRFRGKDNPWVGIEERFPKGTTVNFKCVKKHERVFFAAIEGLDNLLVYCSVPEADKNIEIIEGQMYQGYISKVSEERHMLRGRVLSKL